MPDSFAVILAADEADTGGRATFDLVLQAGPAAIAVKVIIALPYLEDLLRQVQRLPGRTGAWIGSEITALILARTAVETQPGIVMIQRQVYVGITFIITEKYVVARLQFLDQIVFQ